MEVRDGREKILYVEGEPRYEMRVHSRRRRSRLEHSGRRAAAHGREQVPAARASTRPTSWRRGFPKTRAELFHYRSIILGSIEASFFTHDQLAMLADFVNVRGGGLLFLGGRRAFAEGGLRGNAARRRDAGRRAAVTRCRIR